MKEVVCKSGEDIVALGDLERHQKYLGISCQWQWIEKHEVGRREKSKHQQWQTQLPRIKVIIEKAFVLRESSTSEKNCTEMMQLFDFPSAVLYGIIYEKASLISSTGYHCTHGHEVTMQFRRPGQSFFISKTCWYPCATPVFSGLEETVFSWKKDLPILPQKCFVLVFPLYGWGSPSQPMALLRAMCSFSSCFINLLLDRAPAFSI